MEEACCISDVVETLSTCAMSVFILVCLPQSRLQHRLVCLLPLTMMEIGAGLEGVSYVLKFET